MLNLQTFMLFIHFIMQEIFLQKETLVLRIPVSSICLKYKNLLLELIEILEITMYEIYVWWEMSYKTRQIFHKCPGAMQMF